MNCAIVAYVNNVHRIHVHVHSLVINCRGVSRHFVNGQLSMHSTIAVWCPTWFGAGTTTGTLRSIYNRTRSSGRITRHASSPVYTPTIAMQRITRRHSSRSTDICFLCEPPQRLDARQQTETEPDQDTSDVARLQPANHHHHHVFIRTRQQ